MTGETINAISRLSDKYGDKLLEIMDRCGVTNARDVPEDKAREYLEELKSEKE